MHSPSNLPSRLIAESQDGMSVTALARILLSALVLLLLTSAAWPQGIATPGAASAANEAAATQRDPLGRETPQGLVSGLISALADADYGRAAQFLEVEQIRDRNGRFILSGPELAKGFQEVLDRSGAITTPAELSATAAGRLDDNLAENAERFGVIRAAGGEIPLLARRVERDGVPLWYVSADTLEKVPALARSIQNNTSGTSLVDRLPKGPTIGGVPTSHWLALVVLAGLTSGLIWLLMTGMRGPLLRIFRRRGEETDLTRYLEACAGPIGVLVAVLVFRAGIEPLGISVVARYRVVFLGQIIGFFAMTWLLWRTADAAGAVVLGRMSRRGQLTAYSAVSFSKRAAKALLIVILGITLLGAFGVDVTTGLAALGIGGLAIALGAQKLFENLIGSLTLIADRPVRIGDFCRFGSALGTVEEIGIRSTRIRTLDRTILTVPNGEFSSLQIENYSKRDRFWFHPVLNVRYETSPDQVRFLLQELRTMLLRHPQVDPDPARVRFIRLGAHSLDLEVFAYVHAKDYDEFLEIQEELLLRCMEVVEQSGTGFALPSHTLYLGRDNGLDEERAREAERAVRGMKAAE
ncbi:inorganic phosphate transporter family protein [Microvirga roseola]|uniref:inorganic phosphate transporter family protein n=1 Tax=Microvirga roseola TaxID=2883126 RepID=UPI001E623131|nr:mechanosensitive ion channel family protein [Microvirga roseola]